MEGRYVTLQDRDGIYFVSEFNGKLYAKRNQRYEPSFYGFSLPLENEVVTSVVAA